MKKQGVVIDYDGYNGIIETSTKEKYFLLREEIISDEELKVLDRVMFVPESKQYDDEEYHIARFVRKLSYNPNNKDLNK